MIHGPCGRLNMNSRCMSEDGYPKYRRRSPENGGFYAKIRMRGNQEIEVDNQWVVAYNLLLSKMFQTHVNVEYRNSLKSIKYVCKYVHKRRDMAVFAITRENREQHPKDKILQYQMGRYINSNEAAWRILGFPIHDRNQQLLIWHCT
ncbi:hypothetical protein J437_LFUL012327 [Ladona fulva]|uniref:Uncharacterized protein n=1 Tax=Ladona fulva TaxID=123851 RepID=A0A8K0P613_LADFU|nr:hypothetical protein J437_LFUL012327 [Ladona fulva]